MIHLKSTCDTRREKKDGTHPIVFRITLNGKSRDLASGFSCKYKEWNSKKNCIRAKTEELLITAQRLKDKELLLMKQIREFENKHPKCVNPQEVKDYLSNKKKTLPTVLEFWQEEITRQEKAKRYGNVKSLKCAMNGINNRMSLAIAFDKINYSWLATFETTSKSDGMNTNGIAVYFRTLRGILNKAIDYEYMDASLYPFRRFKIRTEATQPRVATIDELRRFFTLTKTSKVQTEQAWHYGQLIFLMRGINFTDLALLTKNNIHGDRIVYNRSKTHKLYSIKILPDTQKLLNIYFDESRDTLLPILTQEEYLNKSLIPLRIAQKRKTTNKWLKLIGKQLDIEISLSTYVFRYSHANACKSLGYSKDLISESLGHGYGLAVSSAYLENYDIELVDEMNRVVCKEVLST